MNTGLCGIPPLAYMEEGEKRRGRERGGVALKGMGCHRRERVRVGIKNLKLIGIKIKF